MKTETRGKMKLAYGVAVTDAIKSQNKTVQKK